MLNLLQRRHRAMERHPEPIGEVVIVVAADLASGILFSGECRLSHVLLVGIRERHALSSAILPSVVGHQEIERSGVSRCQIARNSLPSERA